jgi:hypothetical protein
VLINTEATLVMGLLSSELPKKRGPKYSYASLGTMSGFISHLLPDNILPHIEWHFARKSHAKSKIKRKLRRARL